MTYLLELLFLSLWQLLGADGEVDECRVKIQAGRRHQSLFLNGQPQLPRFNVRALEAFGSNAQNDGKVKS